MMFQLERQVLMTYTSWRWMWLIAPVALLMMVGAAFIAVSQRNHSESLYYTSLFGLGMPILMGIQWFVAVAKWQFANPRARLMPGYAWPHLNVIGAVLTTLLVLNPILLSACQGISPLGPLAYALLLGGLFLYAIQFNSGPHVVPAMIVFFSGMYPRSSQFWFSGSGGYGAIHFLMAVGGLAMVVAWLWRLAELTEEMDDYQVMPLGAPGSLSRLELSEQRRMQGRKVERGIWGRKSTDFWHDRLAQQPMTPAGLAEYGWGQLPGNFRALLIGLGCAVYGIALTQLTNIFGKTSQPAPMIVLLAVAIPGVSAGVLLRQRKSRLAQELLRPASREECFDRLIKSLAKQVAWMWLSLSCAGFVVAKFDGLPAGYDLTQLVFGYLLWVSGLQLLLFALSIYMARWRSSIAFFGGGYAIFGIITGILMAWADSQKYLFPDYSFYFVSLLMGIGFAIVGWWLMRFARRAWLREELG